MRTTNGTAWSAVTMVCYADLIRAGKELGCVAESARKTDTVEIEEIMKRSNVDTGYPSGCTR